MILDAHFSGTQWQTNELTILFGARGEVGRRGGHLHATCLVSNINEEIMNLLEIDFCHFWDGRSVILVEVLKNSVSEGWFYLLSIDRMSYQQVGLRLCACPDIRSMYITCTNRLNYLFIAFRNFLKKGQVHYQSFTSQFQISIKSCFVRSEYRDWFRDC
jgi:hypothetical protein